MYLIPKDLPLAVNPELTPAFAQTPLSQEEKRYALNLNEQRKKFYYFFFNNIEIIMSRYCYSFGLLASLQQDYNELMMYKGNFEELSKRIKHMLATVEDACLRMAKLFYLKDILWSSLEKVNGKYSKVAELNYHLLEAVFL